MIWVTDNELILALNKEKIEPKDRNPEEEFELDLIRFEWDGVREKPVFTPEEKLSSVSNFLIGDQANWRTGVSEYAKVRQTLKTGVDLVLYSTAENRLQFDLEVKPGARVADLGFTVRGGGAEASIDVETGQLKIATKDQKELLQSKPVSYQKRADGGQDDVSSNFIAKGNNRFGFNVGNYDHSRTLVIDPVIKFQTYFGGSSGDVINDMQVTDAGEVYVGGWTTSSDLAGVTTLMYQDTLKGYTDGFISKLNADGALLWSTYLGGRW